MSITLSSRNSGRITFLLPTFVAVWVPDVGGCLAGFWQLHIFLNTWICFRCLRKKNELANLQCHLFKENKKEKWPACLVSCWLQFSSSLLCFLDHESPGREENKGAESTKPQQKSSIWCSDFEPLNVKLHCCTAPQREIRAGLFIGRRHMSTVMMLALSECFLTFLFRSPSQYRARLNTLIKSHLLSLSLLYLAHYLGQKL